MGRAIEMETDTERLRINEIIPSALSNTGTVDTNDTSGLRDRLQANLLKGTGPFILDFRGIGAVGSEVFEALIDAAELARSLGRPMELAFPPELLLWRIRQAGLEDLFSLAIESLPDLQVGDTAYPPGIRNGLPLSVPSELGATRCVRDTAAMLAREMGFDEMEVAEIELSVGEAAVNAVRYGNTTGGSEPLSVRYFQGKHALIVEIDDQGPGFDQSRVPVPSPHDLNERGLGIFLMRSLMDHVEFIRGKGMTVQLLKRLAWSP